MQFLAFFRVMLTQKQENVIGGFKKLVNAKQDKKDRRDSKIKLLVLGLALENKLSLRTMTGKPCTVLAVFFW